MPSEPGGRGWTFRLAGLALLLLSILLLGGTVRDVHSLPWDMSHWIGLLSLPPSESPTSKATPYVPTPSASAVQPTDWLIQFLDLHNTAAPVVPDVAPTFSLRRGICGTQLETPIGADQRFVIHWVRQEDSLGAYAATYHTSVEAILAVNSDLHVPILTDSVIIIPVNQKNVQALPALGAYPVPGGERTTSLDTLAAKLGVDSQELARINDFSLPCHVLSGWLLVPDQTPTP